MAEAFTDPKYATQPMCADALGFWKVTVGDLVARGLDPKRIPAVADALTLEYVERCVRFAESR